jgi:hypothetical protein
MLTIFGILGEFFQQLLSNPNPPAPRFTDSPPRAISKREKAGTSCAIKKATMMRGRTSLSQPAANRSSLSLSQSFRTFINLPFCAD